MSQRERMMAGAAARSPIGDARDPFAALDDAIRRGDLDAATDVVRTGWFELARPRGGELQRILARIPAQELRTRPLLALLLGLCYNVTEYQRERALRYFVLAVRATAETAPGVDPIDRALVRAAEGVAYRLLGRPRLGVEPARRALAAVDALSPADRDRMPHLADVYDQIGITLYYGGDVDGAMGAFEKGLAEPADPAPSASAFGNLAMLAGIHALRGDLPQARAYIAHARTGAWSDQQRKTYAATFYRLAEAMIALEGFDAASALAQLDALTHDPRTIEHWTAIAHVDALARVIAGTPGRALADVDALARLRGAEGRAPSARAALARTRALLHLALGDPIAADAVLTRDLGTGPEAAIDRARVRLALGMTGSALTEVRSVSGEHLSARAAAESAALEAAVMLRIAVLPRARGVVEHLGAMLVRTEQRLPLALLPPPDHARVVAALRELGFAELVDGSPVRSVLAAPPAEPPLTHRELAVLATLSSVDSVAGIAARLSVSTNTVKTHLRSIYRKLGVSSREDAIAVAIGRHLLVERD